MVKRTTSRKVVKAPVHPKALKKANNPAIVRQKRRRIEPELREPKVRVFPPDERTVFRLPGYPVRFGWLTTPRYYRTENVGGGLVKFQHMEMIGGSKRGILATSSHLEQTLLGECGFVTRIDAQEYASLGGTQAPSPQVVECRRANKQFSCCGKKEEFISSLAVVKALGGGQYLAGGINAAWALPLISEQDYVSTAVHFHTDEATRALKFIDYDFDELPKFIAERGTSGSISKDQFRMFGIVQPEKPYIERPTTARIGTALVELSEGEFLVRSGTVTIAGRKAHKLSRKVYPADALELASLISAFDVVFGTASTVALARAMGVTAFRTDEPGWKKKLNEFEPK